MEEKKLFNPIVFDEVDPRIVALGTKSADEKIYLVLYERYDEDGNKLSEYLLCKGRDECYRSIDRLLHTYSIDVNKSVVLVEVPGINLKGKAEWFMKGISNALSIYEFCKVTERYFGDAAFDIDEFVDDNYNEKDEKEITMEVIKEAMNTPIAKTEADVFGGSQELADVYSQAMKEK